MERPVRRHTLTIEIGADTWDELQSSMREISDRVESAVEGNAISSVMGGPGAGWVISYRIKPDMTHERYMAELHEYLAKDS